MDEDQDLFASSSLFSSFSGPKETDEVIVDVQDKNLRNGTNNDQAHLNGNVECENNGVSNQEFLNQEDLIVLDETGESSDSDNDVSKVTKHADKPESSPEGCNHDIQIIESKVQPTIHIITSDPLEITLDDDTEHEKPTNSCQNSCQEVELLQLTKDNSSSRQELTCEDQKSGLIINSDLGFEIKFLTSSSKRKYYKLFENFIKTLVAPHEEPAVTNSEPDSEIFSDFCIDKTATADSQKTSKSNSSVWKVPRYNQDVKEVLKINEVEIVSEASPKNSARGTCFNCLGDHMISNCPNEKDRRRIALNRDAFTRNKNGGKATRYHVDEDLRFSKFKPGRIGDELRKALGLSRHHVPFYIYKMRLLGYPPGWLKEAEVTSSGLTVYDSEGKEVVGDVIEDGEVYDSSTVRVQYDPNKLVEYPGFNVFLPYGFKDEHARYGYPPIQDSQLKSTFGKSMKAPEVQPYKRKSTSNAKNEKRLKLNDKDANLNDVEMEIEEINLEPADPEPQPSTSYQEDSEDYIAEITICNSPSLEELEQVKKNLLDVLSTNTNPVACASDANESLSKDSSATQTQVEAEATNSSTVSVKVDKDIFSSPSKQDVTIQTSVSKSVELGSPSIIKVSNVNLPSRENFSVGITEHIPFENLPGATGQFEKLREVLGLIRNAKS